MKPLIAIIISLHCILFCSAEEIDFLSSIKNSPETSKAVGLSKLTVKEQQSLNGLLNRAYQLGVENQAKKGGASVTPNAKVRAAAKNSVYTTRILENQDDVLKLANGGIVQITRGFLGFVGFRKDAVLFKDGIGWKIWIEGKKVFSCDVLKAPAVRPTGSGEKIYVFQVKGGGKILTTLTGSIYEVGALHTIETSLWLGNFDALVIDGTRLLNFDEGGEIIDVRKLK